MDFPERRATPASYPARRRLRIITVSAGSELLLLVGNTIPSGASRREGVRSFLGSAGGALMKWSHRGSGLRLLNILESTIAIERGPAGAPGRGYFDRAAFSSRSFMISNRRVFSFSG